MIMKTERFSRMSAVARKTRSVRSIGPIFHSIMIRILARRGICRNAALTRLENSIKSSASSTSATRVCEKTTRCSSSASKRWNSTSNRIENGDARVKRPGSSPLLEKTVGQMLGEAARRHPNRICIVSCDENIRLTFAEVLSRADQFAAGLMKLGLKKGDHVAIWGPNGIDWFLTFYAAARAGLRIVCLNPADQENEIEYCLKKTDVRVVVTRESFKTQKYVDMVRNVKSRCPLLEHVVVTGDNDSNGARRFVDVENSASKVEIEAIEAQQDQISPFDAFPILLTSGTTGRPKATQISHHAILNNANQVAHRLGFDEGEHSICMNVPMFHGFGLICGIISGVHAGSTLVIAGPSFTARSSLDAIVREKCNAVYGTPTMWVDMVNAQHQLNAPIRSMQIALTGGSPASPELFRRMKDTFHLRSAGSIYGMTETLLTFQSFREDNEELAGTTVGHLSDNVEVKVIDENGNTVPFGSPGELLVRGYCTMMGYYNDEENTKKTFTNDGFLKTGDQFVLESNGYGKIVGRLKDLIIRGGENIFPKEIEDFLQTHPTIAEAQVIGVPDDRLGEEVCAYIRLRGPSDVTSEAIKTFARGKIAHYKIPKYIHFVDDFPKTASGKVKKHLLRRSYEV